MKKQKMKISFKSYFEPTPKLVRKIADSLLAGATLASTFTFIMDYHKVALSIMVISVVAKVLSNFLSDEDITKNQE